MSKPDIPLNEKARLEELYKIGILDSENEKDYDDLVQLASKICEVPMSLITLVDASRQWFKSKIGIDAEETHRDVSFCGHAILQDELFIIEDATKDKRFFNNPAVTDDPHVRFYAGAPLITNAGYNLGTLCVVDTKPKKLNDFQKNALIALGRQAANLLELRKKTNALEEKTALLNEKVDTISSQNKELRSYNILNDEITSIISHDLRWPVSSILAYLTSKNFQEADPDKKAEMFPIITERVKGINNLIENLIDWSRGYGTYQLVPVKLHEMVEELFLLFRNQASDKKISFKNQVSNNLSVQADKSMLSFILRNLISNAIKFTDNGEISVSATQVDQQIIIIKVNDTGIGMNKELLERINEGIKGITTPGTQNEKGSGLGLRLINKFLEKHHSALNIQSEKNKGSSFSFELNLVNK